MAVSYTHLDVYKRQVIPNTIPGFEQLNLPGQLEEIVHLRNGIVLVTGPTGSGLSLIHI